MNISKNSWHYLLLKHSPFVRFEENMPQTVCTYVATLIGLLVLIAHMIPGVIFVPLMVTDWFVPFVRELPFALSAFIIIASTVGILTWAIAFIIAMLGVGYHISEWNRTRIRRAEPELEPAPKQPSLLVEWFRGLKGKYCTLINYTE